MANAELTTEVLDSIEADLSKWRQGSWWDAEVTPDGELCSTTACLAGATLLHTGAAEIKVVEIDDERWDEGASDWVPCRRKVARLLDTLTGDEFLEWLVPVQAAELLGLDEEQVRLIFYNFSSNWPAFRARVERVIAGDLASVVAEEEDVE